MHHLRYFLAVARELNFTRAARVLNMSVPPLSQRIRDLERELGEPLFDRSTHHTRLSAAGEALLPLASSVVAEFDAIPQAISSRDRRVDVRLAVPDVLNPDHRRGLVDSIHELGYRYRFTIRQMASLDMESAMLNNAVDLAISHVGSRDDRLATISLYREPMGAMLDASRFPGRTSLTIADLRGYQYIQGPRHWDLGAGRADQLAANGVLTDADVRFSDTTGLLLFLRSTKGFSIAPVQSQAVTELGADECVVLPVEDLNITLTTYLVRRAADPGLEAAVAVLREVKIPPSDSAL